MSHADSGAATDSSTAKRPRRHLDYVSKNTVCSQQFSGRQGCTCRLLCSLYFTEYVHNKRNGTKPDTVELTTSACCTGNNLRLPVVEVWYMQKGILTDPRDKRSMTTAVDLLLQVVIAFVLAVSGSKNSRQFPRL